MLDQDPDLAAPNFFPHGFFHILPQEEKGLGTYTLSPLAVPLFLLIIPLRSSYYAVLVFLVASLYHLFHYECIYHAPFQIYQPMSYRWRKF